MQINTRLMSISDFEQVQEIDILTQVQYLGNKFNDFSPEEKKKHLVSRQEDFEINVETKLCCVAEDNNTVIGFLFAHQLLPLKDFIFVRYIAVHPQYQDKGVGSLLYAELIKNAKKKKVKQIRSLINLDNQKSIKLHEKLGFELCDRKEAILNLE